MKLNEFIIKELYGEYSFRWKLDEKVNILAGINGSYKSTLLKIIRELCYVNSLNDNYHLSEATLSFSDEIFLKYKRFEDSLLKLRNESDKDEMLQEIAANVKADFRDIDEKGLSDRILKADIIAIKKSREKFPVNKFKELIRVDYISTFDVPVITDDKAKKSALDIKLEDLEKEYAYYLSDLAKEISSKVIKDGNIDKADLDAIYRQRENFLSIINDAFSDTNKVLDTSKSRLEFKLNNGKLLHTRDLSSGEKQFLIIMLTVLLEKEQEYILLMDEPEISMHFGWQRNLLLNIQRLNPNSQIILVTHSPALIMDGWEQLVTNMNEIRM